jgi:hypothetical protein
MLSALPLQNSIWLLFIIAVLLIMLVVVLGATVLAMGEASDQYNDEWDEPDVEGFHHVHLLPPEPKGPYDHRHVPYDWRVDD